MVLVIVFAQLTFICVWGTLVQGTFWVRLPWTLFLLQISWCFLTWGVHLENGPPSRAAMLGLGLIWFCGFLVSFIPLKIAALFFGWRIIHPSHSDSKASARQFAIRDMLIGTVLLAATMAIGQRMLPDEEATLQNVLYESGLDQRHAFVILSLYAIASLLLKFPSIWVALACPVDKLVQYTALWSIGCFLVTLGEVGLLVIFLGPLGPDGGQILMGFLLGHELMGWIIIGVLHLLRKLGYHLEGASQAPSQTLRNDYW
ncbi:MAG: hypothetical protein R3C05_08195 [Pirellulaceae bacterium]